MELYAPQSVSSRVLDDYHNDLVGRSVQDIVDFGIPLVPTGGASFRADPRFYLEP